MTKSINQFVFHTQVQSFSPINGPFRDGSTAVDLQSLFSPEKVSQNTSMLIGYARVSTEDQNLDLQRRALAAAGCTKTFEDQVSGAVVDRPGLSQALKTVQAGDVLVVWKLDRLGRSLAHLIDVVRDLGQRGVDFRSLSESIDTTTVGGRLVFHMMGSLAEFERSLIGERTRAGIAAAKARGVHVGRRKALTPERLAHARMLIASGESPSAVARSLEVGRSTLYRALEAT